MRLPARGASVDEYATLYAGFGLDRAQVLAAMRSPETDARMEAARDFMMASGVEATPTMIVNGRYRVIARSYELRPFGVGEWLPRRNARGHLLLAKIRWCRPNRLVEDFKKSHLESPR